MRHAFTFLILFYTYMLNASILKNGPYLGLLHLNPDEGVELPFNFDVTEKQGKQVILIKNGSEIIEVDEIEISGDSVNFKMPVFDTEFRCRLINNNLEGVWINNYRSAKNRIRFTASYSEKKRFPFDISNSETIAEGNWEVVFSPNSKEQTKAVGIFKHQHKTNLVTGTFLTETGDYRYLEGLTHKGRLFLSCFDGSHAFLFTAQIKGDSMINGKFYSGSHWQENWTARRNPDFKLRNAAEITTITNTNQKLDFSFPSLTGHMVSLSDEKFLNRPVIIQLMGSWCPNCMDESVYLNALYNQYHAAGLEIIALAFEKSEDTVKVLKQVQRMKTRLGLDYEILLTLKSGKTKASETFPMLNSISAFPTTVFLNKAHQVVKIHTGFSGPATGKEYETFKAETNLFIKSPLKD